MNRIEEKIKALKESKAFIEFCDKLGEAYDDQFSALDTKNFTIYLGASEKAVKLYCPEDVEKMIEDNKELFDVDNFQVSYQIEFATLEIL